MLAGHGGAKRDAPFGTEFTSLDHSPCPPLQLLRLASAATPLGWDEHCSQCSDTKAAGKLRIFARIMSSNKLIDVYFQSRFVFWCCWSNYSTMPAWFCQLHFLDLNSLDSSVCGMTFLMWHPTFQVVTARESKEQPHRRTTGDTLMCELRSVPGTRGMPWTCRCLNAWIMPPTRLPLWAYGKCIAKSGTVV